MAERRQLTVMFCDLVDSVTLSARLDPEDFRAVLGAYQRSCGAVIQRFGGHVAQYLGDGILAYFGYPEAHDDDARRAVRAGLDIVAAIAQLDAQLPIEKCVPLAVRMGIHTGLVVVADVGSGARLEQLALGETPNVAARIQGLAQANSVLISEATRRLVHSDVALESVGSHALKGMDKPLPLFRVQGHAQPAAWLAQPLAELIGRQSELLLLQDRWAQTIEGTGQVVCLSGEAGIGKSRLLHALRAHAATVASTCLAACGSAHHQNTAFFPVIELLQGLFRFEPGDSAPERLTKLSCGLAEQGVIEARAPNVFAALLSLPIDGAPVSASAGSQRETLEALLALVLGLAARQPVLLVVEDLHWLDPSTLELLGMLIDQAPTASLFLLTAARPNFEPPWGARPHVNALRLGRLKRAEVERLVLQVTGNKPLPPEVLEQIALKTDGVPLFVEELTKTVLELGLLRDLGSRFELIGPLAPLAIPTTVHDSLMARLDRLSTAKSVAQLAAVLGRSFSHELLQAVAQLESGALQRALQQLVAAEVLQQRGSPPLASYSFKHALVQDAAYESLLRSARQVFHQRIATVMDQQFADLAQAHPELLAHHFTEAGLAAQAIPHWQRAAQLSIERCANREAISQYGSALSLLATLPPSAERAQQELDISLGLGPALMATRGYAAPEVERTYERARELAGGPGQAAQRFAVLTGLWRYYLNRARLQTAREVAEQMVALCGEASDTSLPVMAHYALGTTLYYQGELEAAAAQLDRTVALYDVRRNLSVAATDPRITSLCCGAWVLCCRAMPTARWRAASRRLPWRASWRTCPA